MKLCKVVNLSPIDISIEDIGLHLGARCTSPPVLFDSVSSSLDVKRHGAMVRVDLMQESPMPLWPFMGTSAPVRVQEQEPIRPSDETIVLLTQIRDLLQRGSFPAAGTASVMPSQSVSSSHSPEFIPSVIIPAGIESSIVPTEGESDASSVDGSVSALRSLRRSK